MIANLIVNARRVGTERREIQNDRVLVGDLLTGELAVAIDPAVLREGELVEFTVTFEEEK